MAEHIKQKIAFAYKADAEGFIVFGIGRFATYTPAFEIQNAVKIGSVQRVNIGFHTDKGIYL
jgi:hypothetical protein